MARIRKVEVENFRAIKELSWLPANGIKFGSMKSEPFLETAGATPVASVI